VRKLGLDDEGVLELMAVVDLFSGLNKNLIFQKIRLLSFQRKPKPLFLAPKKNYERS